MISEIGKRAGLKIKFQAVPWDGVFGQIDTGKIDTYACCIFPNEERRQKYLFQENMSMMKTALSSEKAMESVLKPTRI